MSPGTHFFLKTGMFGVSHFASLPWILIRALTFVKFGMITRAVRLIFYKFECKQLGKRDIGKKLPLF